MNLGRTLFCWRINFILRLIFMVFIHASHLVNGAIRFCTGWLVILMNVFWAARVYNRGRNNIIDTIIFGVIATLQWIVIILINIGNYHFSTYWTYQWRCIGNWVYFQWLDSECACVFVLRRFILILTLFQILIVI